MSWVLINYYWIELRPYEVFVKLTEHLFFNQSNGGSTDFYSSLLAFLQAKQLCQPRSTSVRACTTCAFFVVQTTKKDNQCSAYKLQNLKHCSSVYILSAVFSSVVIVVPCFLHCFFLFRSPSAQKFLSFWVQILARACSSLRQNFIHIHIFVSV